MISNVTPPAPHAHDGLPRGPVSAKRHPQNFHFVRSRAVPVKIRPSDGFSWSYFPDTHAAAITLTEREFFSSTHTAEASLGKTLKSGSKRSDGPIVQTCTTQDVIENDACEYVEYHEIGNLSRTFHHTSWSSAYTDPDMQLDTEYSSSNALGKAVTKKLRGGDMPGLRRFRISHVTRKAQPIEQLQRCPEVTYDAPYRIRDAPVKVSKLPPTKPSVPCAHKCRDKAACLHVCCKVKPERSVHPSVPPPSSEAVAIDSSLAPGRRPCKHTCRDKTNCLHQCCKIGVLITGATENPRPERHLGESSLTRSHSPHR